VQDTTAKPISHRRVLKIAVPIVIANATVPILGAVDTGVVGQMGLAAPIGAVGIGAIILTAFYWIFGFLRMGTVGLTSQALGQGDQREVAALLTRGLLVGGLAGMAIFALQVPLFAASFWVSPASAEVEGLARQYMQIRVLSAPAAIAIYGITGWLIAQERTRAVLAIQFTMNVLNIVLDLFFVLGFEWGVEGVAIATVIAEWAGLALGLWLCRAVFRTAYWNDWTSVFNRARLKNMMLVNSDILIRSVLLEAAFVSFLFLGARFDDVTLAANQILIQFLQITAYGLDGFAFAAEALVGQAMGARNRSALRRSAILTSLWGGLICLGLGLVFWIAGGAIIDLMSTSPEVQAEARRYLIWMTLAPIAGIAAWMLDGIFIGATRTRDMRNMMLISSSVYAGLVVVLLPVWGNHGLWASLILFFVVRGLTLGWKYPGLEAAAA